MALLKKIKEKLGFGSDSSDDEGGETTVTVERDAGDDGTAAGSETTATGTADAAVDEGETDGSDESTEGGSGGTDAAEAAAEEPTDGEDEEAGGGEADDDAAGGDDADDTDDTDDADPGTETDADGSDGDVVDGEPVERIKGIGPAYGERLGEIGIETVADLAAADPAEVAEGTSVGEKRASKWIDRAEEF
jgi:predicted flap endonuclease-1-like 5' DNA nuclease